MSLNPDIAAFLQLVGNGRASGKRVGMHHLSPAEAREQFDQSSLLMDAGGEELHVVDELQLPVRDGALLNARIYSNQPLQAGAGRPALLYFHGGGYVVGSLDSHDSLCRALAAMADCVVLSVAYRLAPEFRFPTAADDARDAWDWLVAGAADLGVDASRLAVAGDSVGGSLATVLAAQLAGAVVRPRLQVLIYPVTDASRSTSSIERFAEGHLLEKASLEWFYGHYQRESGDRLDPRFSPLLGEASADVAPVLLVLAECDPLHDEGVAYACHLQAAGVAVELKVYAGMTHDFMRMGAIVDEAEEAQLFIAGRLAQAFARG
ncbi:alpha/beta hydrolase [Pseudomonas granadensis]|uniref:alpha/beta hydrolase n=1 Tax=Pseudomonas granadensis TaxID=1421430 RepID=UPI0019D1BA9F|nr:alpha/beta hydrolase [Pseudomonas granadensis]MBN6772486.1 alpha/beta hydrolase [Pseudomonas granadensis]MBN6805807.1 alpha/beta hydrolase [Pseudomonas granadensis]MBN6831153.1 alpha/beta hydrolase [Pseudomonas granadensis]MBN6840298.1 alpha/beta hydrolase [Pseudomonas granadensis]MBN6868057.1 alpha/beta hydrolase [Pseudomonas granadensis]